MPLSNYVRKLSRIWAFNLPAALTRAVGIFKSTNINEKVSAPDSPFDSEPTQSIQADLDSLWDKPLPEREKKCQREQDNEVILQSYYLRLEVERIQKKIKSRRNYRKHSLLETFLPEDCED